MEPPPPLLDLFALVCSSVVTGLFSPLRFLFFVFLPAPQPFIPPPVPAFGFFGVCFLLWFSGFVCVFFLWSAAVCRCGWICFRIAIFCSSLASFSFFFFFGSRGAFSLFLGLCLLVFGCFRFSCFFFCSCFGFCLCFLCIRFLCFLLCWFLSFVCIYLHIFFILFFPPIVFLLVRVLRLRCRNFTLPLPLLFTLFGLVLFFDSYIWPCLLVVVFLFVDAWYFFVLWLHPLPPPLVFFDGSVLLRVLCVVVRLFAFLCSFFFFVLH